MVIKKKNETFNLYTLEVSFGELKCLYDLSCQASGAMVDELRQNFSWYFKRLPPPGAEEPEKGEGKAVDIDKGEPKVEEPGPGEPDPRGSGEEEQVSIADIDPTVSDELPDAGIDLDAGANVDVDVTEPGAEEEFDIPIP
jgi:hypothetical protein